MKTSHAIALIAVPLALAVGYPTASWLMGERIEAALDRHYAGLEQQPYVKLVRRKYERGVFTSTETATFELFGELPRLLGTARTGVDEPEIYGADPADDIHSFRFTVRSIIAHGPLPAPATWAAAVAESELVLEEEARRRLAKGLGDAKALAVRTVYDFDGAGSAVVSSPAFSSVLTLADGTALWLSTEGFEAHLSLSPGLKRASFSGAMPRLELRHDSGTELTLSGLRFEGEHERVFDDQPLLLAGIHRVTLDGLHARSGNIDDGSLAVKNAVYEARAPLTGRFIDLDAKLSAGELRWDGLDFGPAQYAVSLHHLEARRTAALYSAIASWYSGRDGGSSGGEGRWGRIPQAALDLLADGAEVHLDRVSVTTPEGEAHVSARARLKDAGPSAPDAPFMLLRRLDLYGTLGLPEKLLAALPRTISLLATDTPDDRSHAGRTGSAAHVRQQIAVLLGKGYLERQGRLVTSRIRYSDGRLEINGRPANPFAIVANASNELTQQR